MIWDDLDARLAGVPGTVSAYVGRLDAAPTWTHAEHAPHYAASTMKVAVLAALYRAADAGTLDPDTPVPVHNDFPSAHPDGPRFSVNPGDDNDDAVWQRLDRTAPLGWLAERMIVRSSNLATNILLGHVGLPAVAEVWALVGARHSVTGRGIDDAVAREAGITNLVTAADLAALLGALALGATRPGSLATPTSCATMLDVLCAQQIRDDLPAGLPTGVRIAHKNGWVTGVRHGVGVVLPDDAPPYVLAVCTTTDLARGQDSDDDACRLLADISAQVWAARHDLRPAP
ncbi:beta-lactamase class A [Micromonospora pallida]|uniref:Beta-lactamase class A n=1 Tax=Micromonospora pallida TaxID=145854 RepID=A0A1C6RPI9_9ACTN|nr:serine hydrolase [Micromonospora pallida]SCL18933.1 beta-lactamase class A [Micromonospora pallida]